MILFPAIDLRGGKCVRLLQGRDEAVTVYGDNPAAVACEWVRQGATWLHVVNLDGAFGRASENLAIVKRIALDAGVPVQFGGGIRTPADLEAAREAGISKVVLGTVAFTGEALLAGALRQFGPAGLVVAVDTKDGMVTTRGWTQSTGLTALEAVGRLEGVGVEEVLHTDVGRDGMLTGPDLETLRQLLASSKVRIIASGGVSGLEDLRSLVRLQEPRLTGVIVGKALYEGRFTVQDALTTGLT